MADGLFKNYPSVKLVLMVQNSITSCRNTRKWDFVISDPALPGHACGLPTLPTVEYLLDVYQQLLDVESSDPTECNRWGCDPYLSVFTTKWFCFPNIRTPDLHDWRTDEAFVNQFIQVSNEKSINIINLIFRA